MLRLSENQYIIGHVPVTDLVKKFGSPLYVYDGNVIVDQYNKLYNSFNGINLKLKYACKALTNPAILSLLKKNTNAGIDTVSINEVKSALKVGFDASEIIYTPNCVDFSEVEEAIALGVHLNIDNLPYLEKIGQKYGNGYPVCIRINPHIQAGGNSKIQVGHIGSKFGISYLQFEEIISVCEKYDLDIEGLHIHTGSDILDADVFLMGAKVLFNAGKRFKNLRFMDFGSGFKVSYKDKQSVTDIQQVGEKMSEAFKSFCKEYGKDLEIWFEPGKFLVSESGTFLTQATLVKHSPACTFVGVNSGFNHLMRPMMYEAYHDIVNASNVSDEKQIYNVVGYICETDTFGADRSLSTVSQGDIIAFKNAGAYGFEMSSNFNSRLKPAEVLIFNGKTHLIRKRQTFEDLERDIVQVSL